MTRARQVGQSCVELALLAPVLLLLAAGVWDGGSVLREQVVLAAAAQAGARVAATGYGTSVPASTVSDAVLASAGDLALRASDVALTRPSGTSSAQVVVSHAHQLYTPILRQLWGGGVVQLQAQAEFYVPQLSAPAANVTPSPVPCTFTVQIPQLDNNTGYYSQVFQIADRSNAGYYQGRIQATWTLQEETNATLLIYAGNPFASQPNPTSMSPPGGGLVATKRGGPTRQLSATATGQPAGTYTVYFWNFGAATRHSSTGTITFPKAACP